MKHAGKQLPDARRVRRESIELSCAAGSDRIASHSLRAIVIPPAVAIELSAVGASLSVKTWIESRPLWLEVIAPSRRSAADVADLDPGEREAIMLTREYAGSLLLVDDGAARLRAAALVDPNAPEEHLLQPKRWL